MKNKLAIRFLHGVFAIALITTSGVASATALLSFDAPSDVTVGSSINIVIGVSALDAADDVGGFDITVAFDPSVLKLSDYALGSELADPGFGPLDLGLGEIASGLVNVAEVATAFDLSSQPNAFTLATLSFDVLTKGVSLLEFFAADLSNGAGTGLLAVDTSSSSVRAVPVPGVALLIAVGLLTLKRARTV